MQLFHSEYGGVHTLATYHAHTYGALLQNRLALLLTASSYRVLPSLFKIYADTHIAQGTMTFVDSDRYNTPTGPLLHTGTTEVMRKIMALHEVEEVDSYEQSPTGDIDVLRERLERGYGPKPKLMEKLLAATPPVKPNAPEGAAD